MARTKVAMTTGQVNASAYSLLTNRLFGHVGGGGAYVPGRAPLFIIEDKRKF